MRILCSLAAASLTSAFLAGASAAQSFPNDFNHHWMPMHHSTPDVVFTGPALFNPAPFGGSTGINWPSFGDSVRRCYGIDTTQGGRNQSTGGYGPPTLIPGQPTALPGVYESSSFCLVGSYSQQNLPQFLQNIAGLVSIRSASETDLNGDACFSPFFQSGLGGGESISVVIAGMTWGGSGWPWITASVWHFSNTAGTFTGFSGPVAIGNSGLFNTPHLAHVIFESQGPLNGGPGNNQYYVGTSNERTGMGYLDTATGQTEGTGGVTNGNSNHGSALFGVTADVSGAISHTRMFINDIPGGLLIAGPGNMQLPSNGQTELFNHLAFNTPSLWAYNDVSGGGGNLDDGAGGPDWVGSTAPVSIVDLRANDMYYGAKMEPLSAAYDPCAGGLGFNLPIFLWSATPAVTMPQLPMSWDDFGIPAGLVQPGSFALGRFFTTEEGFQTIPSNFDAVMTTILSFTGMTLGLTYTPSQDAFAGDPDPTPLFGGNWFPITAGVSTMSGGPIPAVGAANPNFAGLKLGIGAIGVNLELVPGCPAVGIPLLTNVHNGLTINMQ